MGITNHEITTHTYRPFSSREMLCVLQKRRNTARARPWLQAGWRAPERLPGRHVHRKQYDKDKIVVCIAGLCSLLAFFSLSLHQKYILYVNTYALSLSILASQIGHQDGISDASTMYCSISPRLTETAVPRHDAVPDCK